MWVWVFIIATFVFLHCLKEVHRGWQMFGWCNSLLFCCRKVCVASYAEFVMGWKWNLGTLDPCDVYLCGRFFIKELCALGHVLKLLSYLPTIYNNSCSFFGNYWNAFMNLHRKNSSCKFLWIISVLLLFFFHARRGIIDNENQNHHHSGNCSISFTHCLVKLWTDSFDKRYVLL